MRVDLPLAVRPTIYLGAAIYWSLWGGSMRVHGLSLAIVALAALSAFAAKDDVWILGIDHIDNQGSFTSYAGAGYSGTQSSGNASYTGKSWGRTGNDGVARVYWALTGNSINNNTPVPTTTELYKIDFFGTPDGGHNGFQPIESQFKGAAGETYPIESQIPWQGTFSTNHQYISSNGLENGTNNGNWNPITQSPHAPSGPAYTASGDGIYMWLTAGSWLYAKWDFGFTVDRTWSAIRLTQYTPLPGPPVTGDYNKNGTVDAADYALWRKYACDCYVGSGNPADGYPDNFIDSYDYEVWREALGNHNGSGTGSGLSSGVPEPAMVLLITWAAVVCFVVIRPRAHVAFCPIESMRDRNRVR
jgi:hypothetical protein